MVCRLRTKEDKMTDAAEHFEQGTSLQAEGRYEEAAEAYVRAIEQNPDDGDAWYNRAFCLNELGRYKDAMECVGRALAISPQNSQAMKLKFALAGKVQS
jgi:tetratricopeptide (TPR) repeat protein